MHLRMVLGSDMHREYLYWAHGCLLRHVHRQEPFRYEAQSWPRVRAIQALMAHLMLMQSNRRARNTFFGRTANAAAERGELGQSPENTHACRYCPLGKQVPCRKLRFTLLLIFCAYRQCLLPSSASCEVL